MARPLRSEFPAPSTSSRRAAAAAKRSAATTLTGHLGTDRIYQDVGTSVKETNHFLDSDSQRRRANTVMRLTVVTTLGLVATVATGFLGMNIFAEAASPFMVKLLIFGVVLLASSLLVHYAVAHSKVLSDFMEALADKKLTWSDRTRILLRVWCEPAEKTSRRS